MHAAWILHARAYRESSLLLSLFTRDQGRLDVVARGARRAASRHRALLRPFAPLQLALAGRGPLYTLTNVEPDGPAAALTGTALLAGYYVNELLLRLLVCDDPQEALWRHYIETMGSLAGAGGACSGALRRFEGELLRALGYGLNLERDIVAQRPLDPAGRYEYVLEAGARPLAAGDEQRGLSFSGQALIDIRENRFESPDTRRAARRLLAAALGLYLGDRPLKSRQVLVDLHRLEASSPSH